MTMPPDPTSAAPVPVDGAPAIGADAFIKSFDDAIRGATEQATQAKAALDAANARLAAVRPGVLGDDERKAAELNVQHTSTILEQAVTNLAKQQENKGIALSNYVQKGNASPGLTAHYQALAEQEKAAAAKTKAEAAEWLNTAPERAAQLRATASETKANADLAMAKATLAGATQGDEIARAHIAVTQAQAALESTQAANKQAGLNNTILAATAANAPANAANVTRAGGAAADTAVSNATIAGAAAATATPTAAAALQTAQAGADKATLALRDAQAQFDATTPEMRTGALQADLDLKKAQAAQAQQTLQQAQQLQPGLLAQQSANLAQTQGNTQKDLLGAMYGLPERVKAIADALRSGQIPNTPEGLAQAEAQLKGYISATIAGTTPFAQQQQAENTATTRRGQDYSLAASQGSSYAGMMSTAGNMFNEMNKSIPQGSDLGGRALLGMLDLGASRLQSFMPQGGPTNTNSPLVNSMSTGANVPAAPATTIAPDGTVTIQHTPTMPLTPLTPTTPLLGPGMAGTSNDPRTGGAQNPAFLGGGGLALPHHVDALWANDLGLQQGSSSPMWAGR